MATKRTPGSRPGLIYCNSCGEEYSSSYRRCPFCDEYDEYEDDAPDGNGERASSTRSGGGKRLVQSQKRRRGGGYVSIPFFQILKVIISLAVIAAAIWVVVTQIKPLIDQGRDVGTIDPDTPPTGASASPSGGSGQDGPATNTGGGTSEPPATTPGTSPSPDVSPSTPPSTGGAIGFTLNKADFAFSNKYPDPITLQVTFSPAGTTGAITWESSNTEVATVDANGRVSAGAKRGTAVITATLSNGVKQSCTVYNQINSNTASTTTPDPTPSATPDSGSSTSNSGSSSGTYKVNNPDFTFYRQGETYTLKVLNFTGGVTWKSSNTSVATVSDTGKCTAVGNGTCTVTGTLDDGSTVKAIVRVKITE